MGLLLKGVQKKFLCMVGWHEWVWNLSDYPNRGIDLPPPDDAKCAHCGITYSRKYDE